MLARVSLRKEGDLTRFPDFEIWLGCMTMAAQGNNSIYYISITVKHLLFAWPYFREAIIHDLFTRLYFRDVENLPL